MAIFKNCCGCFSLETGGIILGCLGAIQNIIAIVISAISLSSLDGLQGSSLYYNRVIEPNVELASFKLIIGLILAYSVINLLISAMLILGTVQKKYLLLLPWIIVNVFGVIIYGIIFVMYCSNKGCEASVAITLLFNFVFNLYLWLVIVSLYDSLKKTTSFGPLNISSETQHHVIWKQADNELPPYTRQYK